MALRMNSARLRLTVLSLPLVACAASCGSDTQTTVTAGQTTVTAGPTSTIGLASEITSGSTTCGQFAAGAAPPLAHVRYSLKGNAISRVDPAAFFYWVRLVPPKSSVDSVTITQSTDAVSRPLFATTGSVFEKVNSSAGPCQPVTSTVGQVSPVRVSFIARAGTTFYIGVKFSALAVVGQQAPAGGAIRLIFSAAGVGGSTSEIDLVKR
jgi:hypothetical protein